MHGAVITTNFRTSSVSPVSSAFSSPKSRRRTRRNVCGRGVERKYVSRHAMTLYCLVGALCTGMSVVLCLWNIKDFWGFVAAAVFGAAALASFAHVAIMWFDMFKFRQMDEEERPSILAEKVVTETMSVTAADFEKAKY